MFYVIRGTDGAIQSVSRLPLPESEPLAESDPEIQLFFSRQPATPMFDMVDAEFVRVIEDLIDTLIEKNVIRHTDLPEPAQKKLMLRKGMRSRMQGALDLLGNDDRIL